MILNPIISFLIQIYIFQALFCFVIYWPVQLVVRDSLKKNGWLKDIKETKYKNLFIKYLVYILKVFFVMMIPVVNILIIIGFLVIMGTNARPGDNIFKVRKD